MELLVFMILNDFHAITTGDLTHIQYSQSQCNYIQEKMPHTISIFVMSSFKYFNIFYHESKWMVMKLIEF